MPALKMSENAFQYCGPRVWNSLPYEIRSLDTVGKFKCKLKTYYFNIAFNDMNQVNNRQF